MALILIKKNSDFIYKLAFFHTKNEGDSKIILSQVSTHIFENIHKLSSENKLNIYLYQVTIMYTNIYLSEVGILENPYRNSYKENGKINFYEEIDYLENHLKNVMILKYYYKLSPPMISEKIGRAHV